MTAAPSLEDRITSILTEHQVVWIRPYPKPPVAVIEGCTGCDWRGEFHAAHQSALIATELRAHFPSHAEELGLTQETAVRLDLHNPERSIVLTEECDIRSARKGYTAGDVVDVSRWVTGWQEATSEG